MAKKHTILTMATSQKPIFEDVSSVSYVFIFFAKCISQNIKLYKTLQNQASGRSPWSKSYNFLTMATSKKLVFEDVSSVLCFFMFLAQCISQNLKKYKTLDTSSTSSFWEVAMVELVYLFTMATSQKPVF